MRKRLSSTRLLLEVLEDRLAPATLTVNTLDDGAVADTANDFLSLREAIMIVNSGSLSGAGHALSQKEAAQIDQAQALGTNDTIRFAPILNGGTIALTAAAGGRLDLTKSMSIVGPALGLTISGQSQLGIFHTSGASTNVSIANLTLAQGKSSQGGAILNEATLTVTGCRFTANQAGDGGAIANEGTLNLFVSTFDNNTATSTLGGQGRGGAIVNDVTLGVSFCTFVNNSASNDGGAIFTYKQGGNTSLNGSIVANNFRGGSPNDLGTPLQTKDVNGTFNLIGNADTSGGLQDKTSDAAGGNIVGNSGSDTLDISTVLGGLVGGQVVLGDYGGPTLTCKPIANSPVIDSGSNDLAAAIPADQRGLPRISGDTVDIGAVETTEQDGPYVVTIATDEVDATDNKLSLREAVLLANDHAGADTITLPFVLHTVVLTNGSLVVRDSGTITGPGVTVARSTADGTPDFGVFSINGPYVTLDGLTITNGKSATGGGGGVYFAVGDYVAATLTIRNCRIVGNAASDSGGGLFCKVSNNSTVTVTVTETTISGNTAGGDGGGISASVPLILRNSTVSENSARYTGGGIFAESSFTVSNSILSANVAQVDGGAVYNSDHTSGTLTDCTVANNLAFNLGGGIYNLGTLTVRSCTFSDNQTLNPVGDGIENLGTLDLRDSTLSNNTSGLLNHGTATLVNSTVTKNKLGGIYTFFGASTTLHNTIVAGNTDESGTTGGDLSGKNVESSSRNNLIGDPNTAGGLTDGVNGNIVGGRIGGTRPIATILDTTLADNGGPTKTHALVARSAAINGGDNSSASDLTADQRGLPRNYDGTVDIGAYEYGPIVVDSAGDGIDGNSGPGQFTLREAIALANSKVGPDTITFASNIPTVMLTEGQLTLTDTAGTTILGGGVTIQRSSVSGTPTFRILYVELETPVALYDLTIANGDATNDTNPNLPFGGGILNNGALDIYQCTIRDNAATYGGNILNLYGTTLRVINSTITRGNAAVVGGLYNILGSVAIINSTISGNRGSAEGGGLGQVLDAGSILLQNTLVAGNFTGAASDFQDIYGPIRPDSSNNLIGVDSNLVGITNDDSHGNKIGTSASPIDPKLGPLQNNGGPTSTYALLLDSPAINAGSNTNAADLRNDQRGADFPRINQGVVDIGAFEIQLPDANPLVVDTTSDAVDYDFGPGQLSLREAILIANVRPGADTITFAAALQGRTITLTGGELPIKDALTITGLGAKYLTISGNNLSRIFNIDVGDNNVFLAVSITDATLSNGKVTGNGGAILNRENLTLSNIALTGNNATAVGGALAHDRGALTVTGCTFSGNSAGRGGAIDGNVTASLQISNSTISGNFANNEGAGLNIAGTSATLANVTVTGNVSFAAASNMGGGIAALFGPGQLTLVNCIVAGNSRLGGLPDDLRSGVASPTTSKNNLIGDAASAGGLTNGGVNSNIVGVGGSGTRPIATILNTTLADNGGPTKTHSLPLGSPALNAGFTGTTGGNEQRGAGFGRVQFGAIDIGAFEVQAPAGANLVVDTTSDADDGSIGPGQMSLREAITLANLMSGANTITFASNLQGQTITLTGGELLIKDALTITGRGVNALTISGNNLSRIFNIDDGSSTVKAVTISDVNLSNGTATGNGGAILNRETLTLSNVALTGNKASTSGGGLMNFGSCTIVNSTFQANQATASDGGGIQNAGPLVVVGSTFVGNTSGHSGGGLNDTNAGTTKLINSTFSANLATFDGGAIQAFSTGTLTLTNCTLTGNRAGTGGVGGGGGIAKFDDVNIVLNNTLVAGNLRHAGAGSSDDLPITVSAASSNNLIGDPGSAGGLTEGVNGNRVGNGTGGMLPIGSILNTTLADNGGPTRTHALVLGGRAANAGSNALALDANAAGLSYDQRGAGSPRIVFGVVDIGAFEFHLPTANPLVVDTTSDAFDGDFGTGQLSLREAIFITNERLGADTITFANALQGQTITLTGELLIKDSLTITGLGVNALTISGNNQSRIFNIDDGSSTVQAVTIAAVTLSNGKDTQFLGTILSDENLTLTNCVLTNNTRASAVFSTGSLTVAGCTFTDNRSDFSAGAILAEGPLTVTDSTFSRNHGNGRGAIFTGESATITGCTFNDNSAEGTSGGGGAISHRSGDLTVVNCTFSGNSANGDGGAIFTEEGVLSLINCTLAQNRADADNHASGSGGGLFLKDVATARAILMNCIVAGNVAGASASDLGGKQVATALSVSNLIGAAASAGGLTNNVNGNIVGVLGFGTRPLESILDPMLSDHGGPTLTLALSSGSPALDAGRDFSLITPTAVVSSTAASDLFPASQLIDNSGLSGVPTLDNLNTITHATASFGNNAWVTEDPAADYYTSRPSPVLTFQLGNTVGLTDLIVWGYEFFGPNNNEAKAFAIAFSIDDGVSFGTPVNVVQANRTGTAVVTLPLGGTFTANAVRVTITDNFFGAPGAQGGDRVGLGEVKFIAAVGEPGTDQRGAGFPRQNGPDIGAFEVQAPISPATRSSVQALPARQDAAVVTLNWSGQPASEASSITGYDIYMSTDGGAFTSILTNASATSGTLQLTHGHTYRFFTIAHDSSGFVEAAPVVADASIIIDPFGSPGLTLDPGTRTLRWYGADQADVIAFVSVAAKDGPYLQVTTTVGKKKTTTKSYKLADFDRFHLFGGDGADQIAVTSLTGKAVYVEGGAGRDVVTVNNPTATVEVADVTNEDVLNIVGKTGSNQFIVDRQAVRVNGVDVQFFGLASLTVTGQGMADTFRLETAPAIPVTLAGAGGNDAFTLQTAPTAPLTLDGGVGTDTVVGADAANNWDIMGLGTGKLNDRTALAAMENLTGGAGRDVFRLRKTTVNGKPSQGKLAGKINGGAGANVLDYSEWTTAVTVDLSKATPTATNTAGVANINIVLGGSAADKLTAGASAAMLLGNGGKDTLKGSTVRGVSARDVLIGGSGEDTLDGGAGEDILIGGLVDFVNETNKTADLNSLIAVMAEWARTDNVPYDVRVAHLRQGGGNNGATLLTATNDNGAKDTLTGGANLDWFFALAPDVVKDPEV